MSLRAPPGLDLTLRHRGLIALASLPRHWFLPPAGQLDLLAPGSLDFMSAGGGCGQALLRAGSPWVLSLTRASVPDLDPYALSVLDCVQLCNRAGCFACLGLCPQGDTLSAAWQPPIRSQARPHGVPHLPQGVFDRVVRDNRLCTALAGLIAEQPASPTSAFWVLAPDSSFLWGLPGFRKYAGPASPDVCRLDLCRYGTRWQKRSRIATNTSLAGGRCFCTCREPHVRLRGRPAEDLHSWPKHGAAVPRGLALELALSVASKVGWGSPKRSSAALLLRTPGLPLSAAIARTSNARPGEAANPGPRRAAARDRTFCLEFRPLLGQQSIGLGEQGWSSFLSWSSSRLSFDSLELFSRSAALLAMALRAYGNWLYSTGGSLYTLRHTLLAGQRQYLDLRPYARVAWELVSRWEHAEPPVHRTPIPEPILKAIVSWAWMCGYRFFAGATILAFYGLGRIGEVLQCKRSDLLLPSDDLWDQHSAAFLRLGSSRTATRGRPKVQHLKILDEKAIELLTLVFRLATSGSTSLSLVLLLTATDGTKSWRCSI